LGLSTAYGIVKQHGGYITVSSEPGRGTTFGIYLPVVDAEIDETERGRPEVRGGTETILFAEDDREIRKSLGDILRAFGYTVMEAKDGEDAVNKYRENGDLVDLVILDVVMPVKNGKEAYDEIRKINPSVRATFMSGYTGDVLLDKGVRDTNLNYLSKPVSTEELLRTIRELLDR
jgi:two-component system, cell cycle sensor histidine kinase and response regulator CckA